MHHIEAGAEFDEARNDKPIFLAYFSTPQCNVCKALIPKIDAVLDERSVPGLYVDTTRHPAVSGQLVIFTVPTLVVFVYGKELARFSRHVQVREVVAALDKGLALTADP